MEYIIYEKGIDVSLLKQNNIVIAKTVRVAEGVKIFNGVSITGNSVIGKDCEITTNSVLFNTVLKQGVSVKSSYLEDCVVGEETTIGPFAHIRGGSVLGANCRVGNFVEIKNAQIGDGTKMAHLAYIGDATIGKRCNIGCGVIFCNYNGKIKQRSSLGDNVFVGCNSNLIAPLNIEDDVYIAGGSTITQDIPKSEFAIARSRQTNKKSFNNPYISKD